MCDLRPTSMGVLSPINFSNINQSRGGGPSHKSIQKGSDRIANGVLYSDPVVYEQNYSDVYLGKELKKFKEIVNQVFHIAETQHVDTKDYINIKNGDENKNLIDLLTLTNSHNKVLIEDLFSHLGKNGVSRETLKPLASQMYALLSQKNIRLLLKDQGSGSMGRIKLSDGDPPYTFDGEEQLFQNCSNSMLSFWKQFHAWCSEAEILKNVTKVNEINDEQERASKIDKLFTEALKAKVGDTSFQSILKADKLEDEVQHYIENNGKAKGSSGASALTISNSKFIIINLRGESLGETDKNQIRLSFIFEIQPPLLVKSPATSIVEEVSSRSTTPTSEMSGESAAPAAAPASAPPLPSAIIAPQSAIDAARADAQAARGYAQDAIARAAAARVNAQAALKQVRADPQAARAEAEAARAQAARAEAEAARAQAAIDVAEARADADAARDEAAQAIAEAEAAANARAEAAEAAAAAAIEQVRAEAEAARAQAAIDVAEARAAAAEVRAEAAEAARARAEARAAAAEVRAEAAEAEKNKHIKRSVKTKALKTWKNFVLFQKETKRAKEKEGLAQGLTNLNDKFKTLIVDITRSRDFGWAKVQSFKESLDQFNLEFSELNDNVDRLGIGMDDVIKSISQLKILASIQHAMFKQKVAAKKDYDRPEIDADLSVKSHFLAKKDMAKTQYRQFDELNTSLSRDLEDLDIKELQLGSILSFNQHNEWLLYFNNTLDQASQLVEGGSLKEMLNFVQSPFKDSNEKESGLIDYQFKMDMLCLLLQKNSLETRGFEASKTKYNLFVLSTFRARLQKTRSVIDIDNLFIKANAYITKNYQVSLFPEFDTLFALFSEHFGGCENVFELVQNIYFDQGLFLREPQSVTNYRVSHPLKSKVIHVNEGTGTGKSTGIDTLSIAEPGLETYKSGPVIKRNWVKDAEDMFKKLEALVVTPASSRSLQATPETEHLFVFDDQDFYKTQLEKDLVIQKCQDVLEKFLKNIDKTKEEIEHQTTELKDKLLQVRPHLPEYFNVLCSFLPDKKQKVIRGVVHLSATDNFTSMMCSLFTKFINYSELQVSTKEKITQAQYEKIKQKALNLYFISHNQELLNQSIKALKAELDSVGILNDPFLIELKQALETYVKGIHFLEPNNFKNQKAKTIDKALDERCVGVRQFVGIKPQDFSKIKEDAKSQNRCFLSVNNKALAPDQVYTLFNSQGQEVSIEGKEIIDGFLSNKAILELLASHVNGFELDIAYVNGRGQDFGKYSLQSNATLYGRLTASLDENIQSFGRLRTDGTTLDGTYNFIGDNAEDLKGALNQINYRHELVFLQDSQGEIDCVVEKVIKGVCSIFYTQAINPTVLEKEKEPLRHFLSSLKGYLTCVARDDESYKRVLLSKYDNIDTIEEGREGRKQLFIEDFAVSLKNKHFDDSKNSLEAWCKQVRVKPQALEDTEEAQGKTANVRQFLEDYQRVVSIPIDQLQGLNFDCEDFKKSEAIAKWIINSCISSNTPHTKFGYNKEGEWVEQGLQKKDVLEIDDMFKVFVGRKAEDQEKDYLRSKFVDTLKYGHKRDTDSAKKIHCVKKTRIALEIFGPQKVFGKASSSINAGGHHVQIYDATKETLGAYIDVARSGNNPKSLKQLLNLDSVQYTASSGEKKAIVCPLRCEYIKDMFAALRSNTQEVKKLLDEGGISAYDSLKKSVSVVTDSLVEAKTNHLIISERKLLEIMRLYDGLSVSGRENELKEFKAYVSRLNLSSEEITKMSLAISKNVYRSSKLEGLIKQDKVVDFEAFIKGLNPIEAWI